jgi:hypothetical protein
MARPKFDMAVLCRHGAAALTPFQDWSGTRGRPNQRTRLNGLFTVSSPILDRRRSGEAFLKRCRFLALSSQQRTANGSKAQYKAKVENRAIVRRSGDVQHAAAKDG